MKKRLSQLSVLILLSIFRVGGSPVLAQPVGQPITIDHYTQRLTVDDGLALFRDTSERVTITQLLRQPTQYTFTAVHPPVPIDGPAPHWLRLSVRNTDPRPLLMLLEIDHPFLNGLNAYAVVNGRVTDSTKALSQRVPIAQRPYKHRNFIVPLHLPVGQPSVFYLRLVKGPGTHAFPLHIWQGDAFRQHDLAETAFWSVLSGWLLFAIVLGGLLFVMHREWVYLLYSLYVLAHLLTLLINEGLLGDYYLAGLPGLAGPYVGDVAIGFITGSNALFVRSLLLSRRYVPRWLFRLSWYVLGFWVVWMLGYVGDSLLRPALVTPWPLLHIAKYGVHLLGAGVTMLLIGYGLRSKPNRGLAMTYLLAFVPLLGVAWFYYFANFYNRHGLELAQTQVYALTILFEMLILLVGLSYRFKTYRDERERLLREQSQLALRTQLAERERLARDLHDHIGPDLVALKLRLEVARDEATEPAVDQTLQRVIEQTDRIVADIRQVSHALMPTGLRQQGLVVNLADYIRQINHTMSGPEINFTHELTTQLPESMQQTLLSAAKELVSNALRHAQATVIDVELYHEDNNIVLTVSDNGRGYNPKHISYQSGGIGLRNIRTVINGLHGQMGVSAKPTGGMVHQIIIPAVAG